MGVGPRGRNPWQKPPNTLGHLVECSETEGVRVRKKERKRSCVEKMIKIKYETLEE